METRLSTVLAVDFRESNDYRSFAQWLSLTFKEEKTGLSKGERIHISGNITSLFSIEKFDLWSNTAAAKIWWAFAKHHMERDEVPSEVKDILRTLEMRISNHLI